MRRVIASLLALSMLACGSTEGKTPPKPKPTVTRSEKPAEKPKPTKSQKVAKPQAKPKPKPITRQESELTLEDKPLEWSSSQRNTGGKHRRLALLLAADSFVDPAMNIAFTGNNLRAMKSSLTKYCGFQKQHVKTLRGQQLNRDAVEAAILSLANQSTAQDNLLLIYFTGHGFIDSKGQPRFFTYYSTQKSTGQGWDKVMTRADLALWIANARAKLDKGRAMRSLILVDACRTRTMAPPPKARLRAGQDWEIYGTGQGTLSAAPQSNDPSPFTKAFAESVKASADKSLKNDLKSIFEETQRRTLKYTGSKQKPELFIGTEKREPRLVVANRVQFAVEIIDSLNGARIKKGRVALDSRLTTSSSKGVFFVETSPNPHLLAVAAPGYLSRSEQVEISEDQGGATLRVRLFPNVVLVRGQLDPPQVAKITATGNWSTARKIYHRLSTQCDARGRFELRLPGLVKGARVNVSANGQVLLSRRLPLHPSYFKQDRGQKHDDLGVVDLSVLLVKSKEFKGQSTLLKLSSKSGTTLPLPERLKKTPSTKLVFKSSVDAQDFQNMLRAVKAKKWRLALKQLANLGSILGNYETYWKNWILYQQAQDLSLEELKRKHGRVSSTELSHGIAALYLERCLNQAADQARVCGAGLVSSLKNIGTFEQTVKNADLLKKSQSRRLQLVATAIKQGLQTNAHSIILNLISSLDRDSAFTNDNAWISLKEETLPLVLITLLSQTLREGKRTGDWSKVKGYRQIFESQAETWRSKQSGVSKLLKTIDDESIPLATRKEFTEAQRLFADGQWPGAYKRYVAAKKGANGHYLTLIGKQKAFLDDRLAQRYLNEGFEKEFENQPKEAVLAYEKALPHYLGAIRRIQVILDSPDSKLNAEFASSKRSSLKPWIDAERKRKRGAMRQGMQGVQEATRRLEAALKRLQETLTAAERGWINTILLDRANWNRLSTEDQDIVIKAVSKKLGSDYKWTETKVYSCGGQKHRIATFKHVKTGIELNLIPGGRYSMGSTNGDSDERPIHTVTIKPMLVGKYEVTQAQWQSVANTNPSHFKGSDMPVEKVSWNDVVKTWLPKAGARLRLLSESEWEYACRSGATTPYFWGSSMNTKYCWYGDNSGSKTHSVYDHTDYGNAFGLVDMSGNVREWCQNNRINSYSSGPRDHKPHFDSRSYRVSRGGSWLYGAQYCKSARRGEYTPPKYHNYGIGFRVARSLN